MQHGTTLCRQKSDQRGAIAVITAMLLTVMITMTMGLMSLGFLSAHTQEASGAADAAVLAAAQVSQVCTSQTWVANYPDSLSIRNDAVNGDGIGQVTLNNVTEIQNASSLVFTATAITRPEPWLLVPILANTTVTSTARVNILYTDQLTPILPCMTFAVDTSGSMFLPWEPLPSATHELDLLTAELEELMTTPVAQWVNWGLVVFADNVLGGTIAPVPPDPTTGQPPSQGEVAQNNARVTSAIAALHKASPDNTTDISAGVTAASQAMNSSCVSGTIFLLSDGVNNGPNTDGTTERNQAFGYDQTIWSLQVASPVLQTSVAASGTAYMNTVAGAEVNGTQTIGGMYAQVARTPSDWENFFLGLTGGPDGGVDNLDILCQLQTNLPVGLDPNTVYGYYFHNNGGREETILPVSRHQDLNMPSLTAHGYPTTTKAMYYDPTTGQVTFDQAVCVNIVVNGNPDGDAIHLRYGHPCLTCADSDVNCKLTTHNYECN